MNCKCKDCIYRRPINSGNRYEKYCLYAYVQYELGNYGEIRGSSVENCTKRITKRSNKKLTKPINYFLRAKRLDSLDIYIINKQIDELFKQGTGMFTF